MYTLTVKQELNIGRQLRLPYDMEHKDYGLRWNVTVLIKSKTLNTWGMAVDGTHVQEMIKRHNGCFFQRAPRQVDQLEIYPGNVVYSPFVPTMENMSKFLWEEISLYLKQSPHYKDIPLYVISVSIESEGFHVEYKPG